MITQVFQSTSELQPLLPVLQHPQLYSVARPRCFTRREPSWENGLLRLGAPELTILSCKHRSPGQRRCQVAAVLNLLVFSDEGTIPAVRTVIASLEVYGAGLNRVGSHHSALKARSGPSWHVVRHENSLSPAFSARIVLFFWRRLAICSAQGRARRVDAGERLRGGQGIGPQCRYACARQPDWVVQHRTVR